MTAALFHDGLRNGPQKHFRLLGAFPLSPLLETQPSAVLLRLRPHHRLKNPRGRGGRQPPQVCIAPVTEQLYTANAVGRVVVWRSRYTLLSVELEQASLSVQEWTKSRSFGRWPQEFLLALQTPGGLNTTMPARGTRKASPLAHRISTNVDSKLHQAFLARASSTSMSDARYLRHLIEQDVGVASATPSVRRRTLQRQQMDALAHEVNMLGVQLRKVGTNVNQLAKQANQGMAPVSRREIVDLMTDLNLTMNLAQAVLEKALA